MTGFYVKSNIELEEVNEVMSLKVPAIFSQNRFRITRNGASLKPLVDVMINSLYYEYELNKQRYF